MTMTSDRPAPSAVSPNAAPDLLIVGAGTAGLALAQAAAEQGARVLLLEKSHRIGGTLHISSGMFSAGGARRQRQRGVEDDPELHFNDIMRISRDTVNRDLVKMYCDLAPGMVDWLEDNGFEFEPSSPTVIYGHEPYNRPRTYWGVNGGKTLLSVLSTVLQPYLDSGQVRVEFGIQAQELILESDRVVGVRGAGREYRAPFTVLTTGGYAGSPDLFARFTGGRRLVSIGAETSTGDGIRLGEAAGAALTGDQYFLPTFGGIEDPDRPGRVYQSAPDTWDTSPRLVPQNRLPWEVWVNTDGNRFVREDDPSVDSRERALLKQADMRFFVIFDERILSEAPPIVLTWSVDQMRQFADAGRFFQKASTLTELAGKINVPPAALETTVTEYNGGLKANLPDRLGREYRPHPIEQAPFYALRLQGTVLRTWTGLKANGNLQVLRADGSPIEGLYATGETLGAGTFSGDAFVGGMSIGPAIALSRHLGAVLARARSAAAAT